MKWTLEKYENMLVALFSLSDKFDDPYFNPFESRHFLKMDSHQLDGEKSAHQIRKMVCGTHEQRVFEQYLNECISNHPCIHSVEKSLNRMYSLFSSSPSVPCSSFYTKWKMDIVKMMLYRFRSERYTTQIIDGKQVQRLKTDMEESIKFLLWTRLKSAYFKKRREYDNVRKATMNTNMIDSIIEYIKCNTESIEKEATNEGKANKETNEGKTKEETNKGKTNEETNEGKTNETTSKSKEATNKGKENTEWEIIMNEMSKTRLGTYEYTLRRIHTISILEKLAEKSIPLPPDLLRVLCFGSWAKDAACSLGKYANTLKQFLPPDLFHDFMEECTKTQLCMRPDPNRQGHSLNLQYPLPFKFSEEYAAKRISNLKDKISYTEYEEEDEESRI